LIAKRYRLSELLGSELFYEVWKATDLEGDLQEVVLRVFLPGKGLSEKNLQAFFNQLPMESFPGSNYLAPFKYIRWEKSPIQIVPFYEKESVIHSAGKLNNREALRFLNNSCRALAEIHQHPDFAVHYHLQPGQFFPGTSGQYLLKDYEITPGMFKILAQDSGASLLSFGNPVYKAPEQFSRVSGKSQYTPKGNIFSLGIIFFELITGQSPFGELGGVAMRKNTPMPVLPFKWHLFQPLIEKMLAKDPDVRPDAKSLCDLAEALPATPPKNDWMHLYQILNRWEQWGKWAGGGLLLIVLLMALVVLLSKEKNKSSERSRILPEQPTAIVPASPDSTGIIPQEEALDSDAFTPPPQAIPMAWVAVRGGDFFMGNPDSQDRVHPLRKVTVKDFYLSRYEVTVAQYRAFCQATQRKMPYEPPWGWQDNQPIVRVTWEDARAFADWMGCRLPSEKEWEYAAKGGNQSEGYLYSGSHQIEEVGWYSRNTNARPQEVGQKNPNELGIYDMSGNVWEWCADWYAEIPDGTGLTFGKTRVLRGGSFYFDDSYARSFHRHHSNPDLISQNVGFRLAR